MVGTTRRLNPYESMLSTSTVVVGVDLDGTITEPQLELAWTRTSNCYEVARASLKTENEFVTAYVDDKVTPLRRNELNSELTLEESVVNCGNALPPDGAVTAARTLTLPNGDTRVVFTFNHALNDGTAAWHFLATFLEQLSSDAKVLPPRPLVNVQEELMKIEASTEALAGDVDVSEHGRLSWFPIESKQGIPKQISNATLGTIDSVYRTIPMKTVSSLRDVCRAANASVQGALTAACIVTRLSFLNAKLPTNVPVLIPVNARTDNIPASSCACGSAGIWLLLHITSDTTIRSLASAVTTQMRAALQRNSHIEWTRRIMNQPMTLLPHSFIASSIGMVPVKREYVNGEVKVRNSAFFGGRQPSEQARESVATMVHWATTENESKFALNYTVPGVSKEFATRSADSIVTILSEMIIDDKTVTEIMQIET